MTRTMTNGDSVVFLWPGLPDYAARCIRAYAEIATGPVRVIATRPSVPIRGMEETLGARLTWIDGTDAEVNWDSLGLAAPGVLFCGGYFLPAFNALARSGREAGSRTVLMADNNWTGSLRQRTLDPWRHRLFLTERFDAVFVPGRSGRTWAENMGYGSVPVFEGLYGADRSLFGGGPPLGERERAMLFVGQFIERKQVVPLARAFIAAAKHRRDWRLRLCGSGVQRADIPDHPAIGVEDFVQPPALAEILRQVRCLVLPSLEDHWGLVVHEAAATGCALVLSDAVGAAEDLAGIRNAVIFRAGVAADLERALTTVMEFDDRRWTEADSESRALAARFGTERFARSVWEIVSALPARNPSGRSLQPATVRSR